MDNMDRWNEINSEKEQIHRVWEDEETGDELKVSRFEDDNTWDTFLNERLIANRDEPEEAVERARRLADDRSD